MELFSMSSALVVFWWGAVRLVSWWKISPWFFKELSHCQLLQVRRWLLRSTPLNLIWINNLWFKINDRHHDLFIYSQAWVKNKEVINFWTHILYFFSADVFIAFDVIIYISWDKILNRPIKLEATFEYGTSACWIIIIFNNVCSLGFLTPL